MDRERGNGSMDWGGKGVGSTMSHGRSTVLRKASMNKKKGAFREQAKETGLLLMADHEFQMAQRKRFRRKGKVGNGVRNVIC